LLSKRCSRLSQSCCCLSIRWLVITKTCSSITNRSINCYALAAITYYLTIYIRKRKKEGLLIFTGHCDITWIHKGFHSKGGLAARASPPYLTDISYFPFLRLETTSKMTATRSTPPLTTYCQESVIPMMDMPMLITPSSRAPITTPPTVPTPP